MASTLTIKFQNFSSIKYTHRKHSVFKNNIELLWNQNETTYIILESNPTHKVADFIAL